MYVGGIVFDSGFLTFSLDPALGPVRGFSPVAKNSLIARPEFVFGVAKEGAFIIRPDFSYQLITGDVQDVWRGLNQGRLKYAQSWIRENDHQIRTLVSSASNSANHDRVLVFDWETGDVWFDRPDTALNYGERILVSNEELDWLAGGDSYLYQGNKASYTSDNGTSIPWQVKLSPNDLGMPGKQKKILNLRTYFYRRTGQQTVTLTVFRDQGRSLSRGESFDLSTPYTWNSGLKWDSGLKWPGGTIESADFFVNRTCENFAPQWEGSNPMSLIGYSVEFQVIE